MANRQRQIKASVIIAHPFASSFNHAIYHTINKTLLEQNVIVYSHDLYAEKFDPVLTVEELGKSPSTDPVVNQYLDELLASDILFFVHPNWWGQPPAILKGYVDRVMRPPYVYDFLPGESGGGLPVGKLAGKNGVVFNTSNTEKSREETVFGDPLESIWINCVFGFCGIDKFSRTLFSVVVDSTLEEREKWLEEVRDTVISTVNLD
jgi:NAD(P)H dehydrogenase (quinone)